MHPLKQYKVMWKFCCDNQYNILFVYCVSFKFIFHNFSFTSKQVKGTLEYIHTHTHSHFSLISIINQLQAPEYNVAFLKRKSRLLQIFKGSSFMQLMVQSKCVDFIN